MSNPVQDVQRLGQSIWYDNIRRGLLDSGELKRLIEMGVTGLTSNPTIFEKAIAGSTDYDEALTELARSDKSVDESYEALVIEDIRNTADLLRPIYDRTNGVDGYASLEVSPKLAHDTAGTTAEARRLFGALDKPNVMIKVPATAEGIPAVRQLISEGININVTLIFSLEAYRQVMEAYIAGLEEYIAGGGDPSRIASVASFFVSRVDTAVDALLEERMRQGGPDVKPLMGKAAIANAKLAYREFQQVFGEERFSGLKGKQARPQRPLWASTSTKNPAYSDLMYVEALIGPDTVDTLPPATLTALLEYGKPGPTLAQGTEQAEEHLDALEQAGISMAQVTDKLLADGVKSFADSFDTLLANISEKMAKLTAQMPTPPTSSLGGHLPDVEAALRDLQDREVIKRIWSNDHTVWKPEPTEISDRLGWLNVTESMAGQASALQSFADEVKDAGYRHVVLLGMGGSSLGAEVLWQTFGSAPGYPEPITLDTTVPDWIQAVNRTIDVSKTLFLVSSKSGGTLETVSGYRYYRSLVEESLGKEKAGANFAAITDPDSPLEKLGQEEGFRRIFTNPSDIGGRYAVLSYFGLVPAALAGIAIEDILASADVMRQGCDSSVSAIDNPAAWLGAAMAALALKGRDKLTIVTSPSISTFGLWAEQLLAESTGKEGKGIVPVAGEPLAEPESYGDDRLFVYMRVEDDDNAKTDAEIERLESSGQPVIRLGLRDRYDLGAEFFRWEFATAVAGAVLAINPFDQPNVQSAKDKTADVLQEYGSSGALPEIEAPGSLKDLLAEAKSGDYLAIMAYLRPTPEVEQAMADLRRNVTEKHKIATTFGYGPRFLHSSGQLHKGGPASGLFLQLVIDHEDDIPIPGQTYSFATLADAQAIGDLQVLQELGRRVAMVKLGKDTAAGIRRMIEEIS